MFAKLGTEGVFGLFGDNTGTVIRWGENCVKATNINISILINLFNILSVLNCKHDLLPTINTYRDKTRELEQCFHLTFP